MSTKRRIKVYFEVRYVGPDTIYLRNDHTYMAMFGNRPHALGVYDEDHEWGVHDPQYIVLCDGQYEEFWPQGELMTTDEWVKFVDYIIGLEEKINDAVMKDE